MSCNHEHRTSDHPSFWRSRSGIGFIVIGAVAGYFLVTEHWAHVVGFLPFLIFLACPLMHLFMHGGHGSHGSHGGGCGHHSEDKKPDQEALPSDRKDEKPSDKGGQS